MPFNIYIFNPRRFSDPYVKIYLHYENTRSAKKKTHIKKRSLNPVFNESFIFDLPSKDGGLEEVQLEVIMCDWDRITKNEVRSSSGYRCPKILPILRSSRCMYCVLSIKSRKGLDFEILIKFFCKRSLLHKNYDSTRQS